MLEQPRIAKLAQPTSAGYCRHRAQLCHRADIDRGQLHDNYLAKQTFRSLERKVQRLTSDTFRKSQKPAFSLATACANMSINRTIDTRLY